jgi:hypothetical protein
MAGRSLYEVDVAEDEISYSGGERQSTIASMASTVDRVLGEALKLAPNERARIVAELLATLEPDLPSQGRTDAEWIQEVERRARAAIAGSPGMSWAEARAKVQSRLAAQ